MEEYHENGGHTRGVNGTLSDRSVKYWLIAGREQIRHWDGRLNVRNVKSAKLELQYK